MKWRRWAALALAVTCASAWGSGYDGGPQSAFVNPFGPDNGMQRYALGEFGIPEREYFRVYLIVAYHRLMGRHLSPAQAEALNKACCSTREFQEEAWMGKSAHVEAWMSTRAKVTGAPAPQAFSLFRPWDKNYDYFLNCHPAALATAAKTLRARIDAYGAGNPWVRDWALAQDAVFANCGVLPSRETGFSPKAAPFTLPGAVAADAPEAFRKDRDYQIAAACFYGGQLGEARTRFEAIGRDARSPWRVWGSYLAARARLRAANLDSHRSETGRDALKSIETQLAAVLADRSLEEAHGPARKLLATAQAKLNPEGRLAELTGRYARGDFAGELEQDMIDTLLLLDRSVHRGYAPEQENDLVAWLRVMQERVIDDGRDDKGRVEALRRARERYAATPTAPWLYAVLAKIRTPNEAKETREAGMLAAARKAADGAGATGLLFHVARVERLTGNADEARALLDGLLARPALAQEVSARNRILEERLAVARNYDEFVAFLVRKPYGEVNKDLKESLRDLLGAPRIGDDGASRLNLGTPLELWKRLASDERLDVSVRRRIAGAAWVRAVLLRRDRDADDLSRVLGALVPALAESLEVYRRAPRGLAKQRAAFRVLETEGHLRPFMTSEAIDLTDGKTVWSSISEDVPFVTASWWCRLEPGSPGLSWADSSPFEKTYAEPPAFLDGKQRAALAAERKALAALPNATDYYVGHALAWAAAHPKNPDVPRMLHVAVRSTRGGCLSQNSGNLSYRAFRVLQTKYGTSEWAKRTPYWYGTRTP